MADTRFWLQRSATTPGQVLLHIEEVDPPHRGYCVSVADRHVAREQLSVLRAQLALAISALDRSVRTFDAVEVR